MLVTKVELVHMKLVITWAYNILGEGRTLMVIQSVVRVMMESQILLTLEDLIMVALNSVLVLVAM